MGICTRTGDDQPIEVEVNMTTLEIRVGERERTRRETLERIEAAQHGGSVEERHILNIERERDDDTPPHTDRHRCPDARHDRDAEHRRWIEHHEDQENDDCRIQTDRKQAGMI